MAGTRYTLLLGIGALFGIAGGTLAALSRSRDAAPETVTDGSQSPPITIVPSDASSAPAPLPAPPPAPVTPPEPPVDLATLSPLARVEALYVPISKLSGPARVERACDDAAKLEEAIGAMSIEKAPAGSIIADNTWWALAGDVSTDIDSLVAVCRTSRRQRQLAGGLQTAEGVVAELDADIARMFHAAKKRDLPPNLVTFRSTLAAMNVSSKTFCGIAKTLATQIDKYKLASLPAGVKSNAWFDAYQAVADATRALQCSKKSERDETREAKLNKLREGVDKLALLLPPRTRDGVIGADPNSQEGKAASANSRGNEQMYAGDFEGARKSFEEAIRLVPAARYMMNFARASMQAGRFIECVSMIDRVLASNPSPAVAEEARTLRSRALAECAKGGFECGS